MVEPFPLPHRTAAASRRTTIGVLVGWQVYEGSTIGRYLRTLLRGMRAAAQARGCNLLIACGVGPLSQPGAFTPAVPFAIPDAQFVPVGPWNTDGLVVVPPLLTEALTRSIDELQRSGHPLVFASAGGLRPAVGVDNAGGIREAVGHLVGHGHRRIAFIAGYPDGTGDSAERLAAYFEALAAHGIPPDRTLVTFGEHNEEAGAKAMAAVLASGASFSAVVASNDTSALGALRALLAAGCRVPEDVALIGFDDIRDTRAVSPPLTAVRHATFELGAAALNLLADRLSGCADSPEIVRIPARLVIRRSCGCDIARERRGVVGPLPEFAAQIAAEVAAESVHTPPDLLVAQASQLLDTCIAATRARDATALAATMRQLFVHGDEHHDDPYAWHAGLSLLRDRLLLALPAAEHDLVVQLLDQARIVVGEQTRRQGMRALVRQEALTDQLGQLTAQLLSARDEAQIRFALDAHLPALGVRRLLAATYAGDDEDAHDAYVPLLSCGISPGRPSRTRQFPPPQFAEGDQPYQLAVLPLILGAPHEGFVAVEADDLDPLGMLALNLGAALRSSRLYREAEKGRQLAEEASRLKSRFLSTVSHELRTPLNLIVGLSELLLQSTAAEPTLRADLERIYSSSQHLGRLINDVLDLASSDVGKLRLQRETLDLIETLHVATLAGAQLAQSKGLVWRYTAPPSPLWLVGDRTRLRQIVLNLISNAVKFTERGEVELRIEPRGSSVAIVVADSGIGVTPEEQETIFGEFGRAERVAANGYSGLGLGLAITRQLVLLHGGELAVESRGAHTGATFTVLLPCAPQLASDTKPAAPRPIVAVATSQDAVGPLVSYLQGDDGGAGLVLVVDDDPGLRDLHVRLVAQIAPERTVLSASDGVEALALMRQQPPDLVLLDLMMPNLDGFGVLEAMQGDARLRAVPVVVLTSQSLSVGDLERLNRGVAAVLNKGVFTNDEVLAHLETALGGQPGGGGAARRIVRRAIAEIHARYHEPLGREQIAAALGVSQDHLSDCFHQELRISPITYLNRYRVMRARTLLETTALSITAVAEAVGVADSAYFSRIFQREVGVSPRAYRRGERSIASSA